MIMGKFEYDIDPEHIKVHVPRIFIDFVHDFRVWLHPRYSDKDSEASIITDMTLEEIKTKLQKWGCEINNPNQYWYPTQVASGHIALENGKQFHVRVFQLENGTYELKAHTEWEGLAHPIKHTLYMGLDYENGYQMLKKFWAGVGSGEAGIENG